MPIQNTKQNSQSPQMKKARCVKINPNSNNIYTQVQHYRKCQDNSNPMRITTSKKTQEISNSIPARTRDTYIHSQYTLIPPTPKYQETFVGPLISLNFNGHNPPNKNTQAIRMDVKTGSIILLHTRNIISNKDRHYLRVKG